jgi:tRNA A37 threonylcarbamoyladenosine biosynthesis protein TsaE
MNLSDSPYFTVYDEFNYGKDVYFYHYDLYGEDGIKLKSKGYDIPVPGAYGCLLALIGIR